MAGNSMLADIPSSSALGVFGRYFLVPGNVSTTIRQPVFEMRLGVFTSALAG
jgi:hypothetical protein